METMTNRDAWKVVIASDVEIQTCNDRLIDIRKALR